MALPMVHRDDLERMLSTTCKEVEYFSVATDGAGNQVCITISTYDPCIASSFAREAFDLIFPHPEWVLTDSRPVPHQEV